MRLIASLTLASVNGILIGLALYVRAGHTWVLSGYDRARAADEQGLALWCGNGLIAIGAAGLLAATLIAAAPASTSIAIGFYLVAVGSGVAVIGRGARKFLL